MSVQGLKRLKVWERTKDFALKIYKEVLPLMPAEEKWALKQQLRRSSVSISSNIAEGFGRKGAKEFGYHLGVAKGEASESQDWYIKCERVNFLDKSTVEARIAMLDEVIKMLNSLISKVTFHS